MSDSQCARILAYLKSGGRISPGGARIMFGCDRLAARIHNLRSAGYAIRSIRVDYTTDDGQRKHYNEYAMMDG